MRVAIYYELGVGVGMGVGMGMGMGMVMGMGEMERKRMVNGSLYISWEREMVNAW